MVNSIKVNHNLFLIEQIIGIERKRYPIFEGDRLYIYSPAIQSNVNDLNNEGVDISIDNMQRMLDASSKKITLIIIRYFDDFLILNVLKLKDKLGMIQRSKKWAFKIRNQGDTQLELYLSKSDIKFYPDRVKKEEFKDFLKIRYSIESLESEPLRESRGNNRLSKSVFLKGSELTTHIHTYIKSKGFNYSQANIKNLYLSLRCKPFVIISGISGTGKTKIVQLFAESIGATEDNGQFMLIPVRPDWSDGSELLGYTDIAGDFKEGPLTKLLIHAKEHPERPQFLLLDEMNLARVEYYFSDILSVMESRSLTAEGFSSSKLAETADGEPLFFPDNLYIIGTVNMDETTHPFSKKVLDRANTLQFNEIDLLNLDFLKESTDDQVEPIQLANESLQASYIQISHIYPQHEELIVKVSNELDRINNILKPIHAQVGYRVRDEICFYLAHNAEAGNLLSEDEALDFCFMQKILPRIAGSGERVDNVLTELARVLNEEALPLCTAKIKEMQEKLEYDEFTAFW